MSSSCTICVIPSSVTSSSGWREYIVSKESSKSCGKKELSKFYIKSFMGWDSIHKCK